MATLTLPGADIRGYYRQLGIELPERARVEASVRCFADPGSHRREDHDPSCSINVINGAWKCHGCGTDGGPYDAALAKHHTPRSAIDLMIAHGLTDRRARLQTARELLNASARPSQADTRTRAREGVDQDALVDGCVGHVCVRLPGGHLEHTSPPHHPIGTAVTITLLR